VETIGRRELRQKLAAAAKLASQGSLGGGAGEQSGTGRGGQEGRSARAGDRSATWAEYRVSAVASRSVPAW
jgi:hypothetical protein